jgi:hypothetical protein
MSKDMFKTLPVEVIWAIADACASPEDVAALAMTNRSLRFLLSDRVTDAVAGYVAIASLSVQTIGLTLRSRGPTSLVLGLMHKGTITRRYGLDHIIRTNSLGIFLLISRFITRGHYSIQELLLMLIYTKQPSMAHCLTPYLSLRQQFECFTRSIYKPDLRIAHIIHSSMRPGDARSVCQKMFHHAIAKNLCTTRRFLAERCAPINYRPSNYLHFVISSKTRPCKYTPRDILETVELLCQNGAPVDEKDANSYTPLHLLALFGPRKVEAVGKALWAETHAGCVMAVLRAGATVDLEGVQGRTALWYAVREGEAPMVEMLLDAGSNFKKIHGDGLRADEIQQESDEFVRWAARLVTERREAFNRFMEERRMHEVVSVT